jgi:uncharacterized protein (TIGR02118 family)
MAVNLVVMYRRPADPQAFYEHYTTVHVPLASRLPGLLAFQHGAVTRVVAGAEPWFYLAVLQFESTEALDAALASPEGREAGRDLARLGAGYDMLVEEVEP